MAKKTLANLETDTSVADVIAAISDETKKADSQQLLQIFKDATGKEPKVWGKNYIGFGKYSYTRKGSKQEHEWFHTGFAAQKANLTIYLTYEISKEEELLTKLGKSKTGKGCLYIKKLEDVDIDVLKQIISKSKDATWR